MNKNAMLAGTLTFVLMGSASAQQPDLPGFGPGPVFSEFGRIASVPEADFTVPDGMNLFISFDVSSPAVEGQANRTLNSAARFVNMNVDSGIGPDRVRAAVVVHGMAGFDLITNEAWSKAGREGANPTAAMIPILIEKGVRVILCGQTAKARGIKKEDLVPGVEMAISAMTAHAVLQRQGYTPNPF